MKKQLLISAGIIFTGILGAQVSKNVAKIPDHIANTSSIRTTNRNVDYNPTNLSPEIKAKITNNKKLSSANQDIIGNTYYDLQTNSSVGDRIYVGSDGKISAVWTFDPNSGNTTYPTRGTGYAYFDGATWSAKPTSRIEAARVGWGNVIQTRTGKEVILGHNTTANLLNLATRPAKGTGSWTESTSAVPSATTGGNFWPRLANSGDTIYAISVTQQTASASSPGAIFGGLDGAICFSRSKDGGATWDITNTIPTGLDASKYIGHGGDAYAIAAKGSTVVIVAGDMGKDVTLSKSTDAGATWTSTTVMRFPITKWNPATTSSDINSDAIADTVLTNDGTFAIGLDNTNKAYVFYGNMRVLQVTPSASGFSYFPGTDGLQMWHETMAANTTTGGVTVATMQDLYQAGKIWLPTPASSTDRPYGTYGNALTSFPSVAFDASNVMYLSYSSIVDSMVSVGNALKSVRHVYVTKSSNGGSTWTTPCDVTSKFVGAVDNSGYEGVYASMAKNVNGYVHLVYQRDLFAGYGVPPPTGTNPDAENVDQVNDIVYLKIPVADIGSCASLAIGVKEENVAESSLIFYPNPASHTGTIELELTKNSKLNVSIINSVGQTVFNKSIDGVIGSNKVDVNLDNLSNGLYFYQVKLDNDKVITNKFVVEK